MIWVLSASAVINISDIGIYVFCRLAEVPALTKNIFEVCDRCIPIREPLVPTARLTYVGLGVCVPALCVCVCV